MKKLLLSMILVMTSVVLFAQNNSNEANESVMSTTSVIQTVGGGLMERNGSGLSLNGRMLSDEEVKELVGAENYETYLSAKKQIKTGQTFTGVFVGSAIATAAILFAGYAAQKVSILYLGYIPAIAADVSLPLMCIFKGIGKGRMGWVADDYNKHSSSSVSYNISPSVMHCNTMSQQTQLGLGMTFSVNF